VHIVCWVNRSAYLYVLWVNTEGQVLPVYPRLEGDWARRPAQETPVRQLRLPEKAGGVWPIDPGPAGMETLLLLAREEPLSRERERDLEKALTGLGPQPMADELDVAWFENGEVVRDEPERAPNLKATLESSNPLLRQQRALEERLKDLFPYRRGISFANRGGK
jgi:hypothetical protein